MKQGIHPEYKEVNARCSCGNTFVFNSTMSKDINLDVCDKCHPFYTGKQRQVSSGGRVDKFNKRFGALGSK
ncbi:50S ribosomal protein L31 [Photobacterium kishitanii]|uniref:Large ribosomal subunit protein bL31 n=1 Tax=Photobacterium kishitanii TaxID=318456 RepID=A0AAX0YSD1_9GAMM|nr:50S ribosomal protein L31 [Photobacterium kishitanii]KJG09581.1 50S ribosomal protein L31 [Photobacterium kishitanii]KJG58077.1 50S ribosomal protein L31 [Photobacterium kishitanii]KJG61593.1 50S ribosomal protein L31 [Photobacterium kishitanii]KJG65891.1 50S ribosomal protein L31 [Photobacterium kishitanii]KJG69742.1 50S ribosomal protein L31 [Photobacterium kishitanii]